MPTKPPNTADSDTASGKAKPPAGTDDATPKQTDTMRVLTLDDAALTPPAGGADAGSDPYSNANKSAPRRSSRRTLDDMRKLSEQIKRKRGKPPSD